MDKARLFDALENLVDIIVDDDQPLTYQVSTIVDMGQGQPLIVRQGLNWELAQEWGATVLP